MFPDYDPTREHLILGLMRLQRLGRLDQVELCDALNSEYERGWRHRERELQLRLSWLPWGLRQIVARLAQRSSGELPSAGPHLDADQSAPQ